MTLQTFNIMAIGQSGRLEYEAVLLASSLRKHDSGFAGQLIIAEPQPGPLWPDDPRMSASARALLQDLGATIVPSHNRVHAMGVVAEVPSDQDSQFESMGLESWDDQA